MLYLLIALQAIDAISTIVLLQRPGFAEGNKILAKLFDKFGIVPTLVVIKGSFIAWVLYFQAELPQEILAVLCAGYVWVVYNNVKKFGNDPIS
jgi:hypothetical protein